MRARRTGLIVCRSCLGTRGGEGCDVCHETASVVCDSCGEYPPHMGAEYHTDHGELCPMCFEHMKEDEAA